MKHLSSSALVYVKKNFWLDAIKLEFGVVPAALLIWDAMHPVKNITNQISRRKCSFDSKASPCFQKQTKPPKPAAVVLKEALEGL